jgi:hypothetical protein
MQCEHIFTLSNDVLEHCHCGIFRTPQRKGEVMMNAYPAPDNSVFQEPEYGPMNGDEIIADLLEALDAILWSRSPNELDEACNKAKATVEAIRKDSQVDVYCECNNPVHLHKPADTWLCDKCDQPIA